MPSTSRTERALYFIGRLLVRCFYRVNAIGLENLPSGGVLSLWRFIKFPKRIPYPVTVAFGRPLKAEAADVATMREELLKLGEFCFSRRPSLDRHLAEECVRGLKRRRFATAVIEGTDHTRLSRAKLLGAAATLSRHLRK